MVSECIVILRGYKEVSWKSAKGMMSEGNFLKTLTEMDVDGITVGQVSTAILLIIVLIVVVTVELTKVMITITMVMMMFMMMTMAMMILKTLKIGDFPYFFVY